MEEKLSKLKEILPFGYPTEQYLNYLKNDIQHYIEDWKANNKKDNSNKQLNFNNFGSTETAAPEDADKGLVNAGGHILTNSFSYKSEKEGRSPTVLSAKISDLLYNTFRKLLRDGSVMSLRMFSAFPKPGAKSRSRSIMTNEPITEVNKFGYNPALERRI